MDTTSWSDIKAALPTLAETSGGYTTAQRGIIALPDSQKLFVKIGHDDLTKQWAHKEILVYRFLQRANYPFIPKLIAVNDDETAFALEPLQNDWDWSDNWTTERLDETLRAMDSLAEISLGSEYMPLFEKSFISETADGWRPLRESQELQHALCNKLIAVNRHDIADGLDFDANAQLSSKFIFERTTLVHNDVRADNCAWNESRRTVKLIDWNWAQLGDRRIDVNAFLVHVHKTGFGIKDHASRLDKAALHWLAGFWFKAATQPLLEGSAERVALRDYQLVSGIVAFDLAQNL
ncbi:MAG TPA: phosphotransferase [Candidatus Saccharimonadales bacterium]|nr:phosphotransferase [Candidatus Saccharimonadales bacterium]